MDFKCKLLDVSLHIFVLRISFFSKCLSIALGMLILLELSFSAGLDDPEALYLKAEVEVLIRS